MTEREPRFSAEFDSDGKCRIYDEDFTYDAKLVVQGDFGSDAMRLAYATKLANALNAANLSPEEPT